MNVKYLDHDTYTDIITFDLSEETDTISGDIFISVDRARENAKAYKTTLTQELRRLIVHGILHLLGFKDKTDGEKALMRQKEDYYLSLHP
jgi:rRNA maturation RNase YbeY